MDGARFLIPALDVDFDHVQVAVSAKSHGDEVIGVNHVHLRVVASKRQVVRPVHVLWRFEGL